MFLEFGDHLGNATVVIDKDTSQLVEYATYLAYGATETDYRPAAWQGFREGHRFTGKEEDIEVGLAYFGARYYSPYLTRFISADPLTIHAVGADLNPYAYVGGQVFNAVDPLGLERNYTPYPTSSDGNANQSGWGPGTDANMPPPEPDPCYNSQVCRSVSPYEGSSSSNESNNQSRRGPPPPPPPSLPAASGVYQSEMGAATSEAGTQYLSAEDQAFVEQWGTPTDFRRSLQNTAIDYFPGWLNPIAHYQKQWLVANFRLPDATFPGSVMSIAGAGTYHVVAASAGSVLTSAESTTVRLAGAEVESVSGMGAIRQLGTDGEAAANIIKNTERIESATGTAAYRIPDELDHVAKVIGDVKNVKNLSYGSQLQDFAAYAQQNGYQFRLWVRPTTRLSKPLLNEVNDGNIFLKYLE